MYTVGIVVVASLILIYGFGMRVVWSGGFDILGITFESRAKHDARLEEDRARQLAQAPVSHPDETPHESKDVSPVKAPSRDVAAATPIAKPVRVSYWTDFRGPNRAGVYAESAIRAAWPAQGPPRLWKQPIGGGYASFSFGEGRAYTIEQRRDKEAITAYDPETGHELWAFSYPAAFDEVLGGPGPRATPVYHDGLIYSLGANGDFYALIAAAGKPKWSKNILSDNDAKNIHWAMAGSPLIVGDSVIVTPGGAQGHSIVAYNRLTGAPLWHALNDRAAYTSPMLAELAGRKQIVWISAERVVGIAPEDGKLLWEYPFPAQMDMNCSQPVLVDGSTLLVSSAEGPGAALLEITKNGDAFALREVWKTNRFKNKFNSSVIYQGYAYGFDESILACIDIKTGELKWKGGRYGYGQVLLAGDTLIVTTEEGDVVLVKAAPDAHHEIARFPAVEGRTWNIPALDHGLLLVRNTTEMTCFRIGRTL